MGKRLKDIYPHATKFQVFKYKVRMFIRKVVIISMIAGAFWLTYEIGGKLNPGTIYTQELVTVEVQAPVKAKVLERIAQCESRGHHFDEKTGVVKLGANAKGGSVDIGLFQINNVYWGERATKEGLNLMIEEDNRKMAELIYNEKGTEPWSSSKHCWNK